MFKIRTLKLGALFVILSTCSCNKNDKAKWDSLSKNEKYTAVAAAFTGESVTSVLPVSDVKTIQAMRLRSMYAISDLSIEEQVIDRRKMLVSRRCTTGWGSDEVKHVGNFRLSPTQIDCVVDKLVRHRNGLGYFPTDLNMPIRYYEWLMPKRRDGARLGTAIK